MKLESLKDGTTVLIREPTRDDASRLHRFFLELSPDDRRYLRFDVTQARQVERMLQQAGQGEVARLLAFDGENVVASGVLEFKGEGWRRHMAEIRVIIHPAFRRRQLGTLLIAELFREAQKRDVEKVEVELVDTQIGARRICERLGFHTDAVLPGYVKDAEGKLQTMVVMSCTLDEMWKELGDFYERGDWPDG